MLRIGWECGIIVGTIGSVALTSELLATVPHVRRGNIVLIISLRAESMAQMGDLLITSWSMEATLEVGCAETVINAAVRAHGQKTYHNTSNSSTAASRAMPFCARGT